MGESSFARGLVATCVLIKNGDLAFGQGAWFGERCPTNNVAEMEALLMLMQSLIKHGVPGRVDTVLVTRDSQLIIDFANHVACSSKTKLFLGVHKLRELEKYLSARIVYHQVPCEEDKIADWLCNVAR